MSIQLRGRFERGRSSPFHVQCVAGRQLHHNAIIGTLAALTLRYCPFVFCGSERIAAEFAFRFLAAQVRGIERLGKAPATTLGPIRGGETLCS
jgi:hypothetical protein